MKNLFKHTASQLIIVVPNTTPIVVPVIAPVIAPVVAPNRTTPVVLLLLATLLFFGGCKAKHTLTENTTIKTDSTALWNLDDRLYKKGTLIANLKSDLQRLREENIRLLNETSTHLISYDTTAPVNPVTGKPPIASESFIVTKSTLEQTIKNYETLLKTVSLENQTLTQQNHILKLAVEKMTNENIVKNSYFSQLDRLNLLFYFIGIVIGLFLMKLLACRSINIKHY